MNAEQLLSELTACWENEVVEFKEGGAKFPINDIGKYFSALSNEANIRGLARGWLVFGVHDKSRRVVGSSFDVSPAALNRSGGVKYQITQSTNPALCFNDVLTFDHPDGRVIFFEIPAAPRGVPVAWKGHYYARSGENLVGLGLDKLDAIRREVLDEDWSAAPVEGATYDDLDPRAIDIARQGFYEKNASRYTRDEVDNWDLRTFLDRARLTCNGVVTRAVAHLRHEGLIEGRVPHLHISARLAVMTNQKAAYMKKKERTGAHYRGLLIDYIRKFGGLTRAEINEYMLEEIRGELSDKEKLSKISNLLTCLRRKGEIFNSGTDARPVWKLSDKARK